MLTTRLNDPETDRSAAVSVVCNCVAFTKETGCETPLKVSVEELRNPDPFMVRATWFDPTAAEEGDSDVIAGCGFGGGALFTAIVTVLELNPPMPRNTGTALPGGVPSGTCAFT